MSNLRTADEYRAAAAAARKSSAESWERSDTDGFLSQWAADTMATRYDFLAQVAEDGGKIEHIVLFFQGKIASTDQRDGQYGYYWILNDEAAEAYGKRFFNPSKAKDNYARDRARGITYGTVRVDAVEDSRTGQAREDWDALKAGNFEIISTDSF